MLFLTRGRMRTAVSGIAAGALAATALAFAGAPAQAAESESSALVWNISQQFVDHLKTHTTDGGAEISDDAFAFPLTSVESAAGETTYKFEGSVKGAFAMGATEYYSVTVAEPTVVVDESGSGEITAVVSAANVAFGGDEAEETEPVRVTVAEFNEAVVAEGSLTVTPNWEGVLPADSEDAAALNIPDGQPVDGQAFHPEFLGNVTKGVRAHFYATGDAQEKKAVGDINLSVADESDEVAAEPSVSAHVTVDGKCNVITLDGSGFTGDGIYASLVPHGSLFGAADDRESGTEEMPWTVNISLPEGAFSGVELVAPTGQLIKGVNYSVYTWTQHSLPTPDDSNLTETPVSLKGLKKNAAKVKAKWNKKPSSKKKSALVVAVTGGKKVNKLVRASGKVAVTLKKGKQTKKVKAKLNKKGKVTVKLPKLKKGKWKAAVKYGGNKNFKKANKKFNFKVKK